MTKTLRPALAAIQADVDAMSLDVLTSSISAFDSFQQLIEVSVKSNYRPSLYCQPRSRSYHSFRLAALAERLANTYDAEMVRLNHPTLRAFRG